MITASRSSERPTIIAIIPLMLGPGLYVTGIEPANCALKGRAWHREHDAIPQLAAGATAPFDLEIRAAVGAGLGALAG